MTKTNLESIKKEWEKWAEDKYYCDDKLVEKIAKFWLSKLQQRMDEIEKAFKDTFRGAGEVWFDYQYQDKESEEIAEEVLNDYWDDIIKSVDKK